MDSLSLEGKTVLVKRNGIDFIMLSILLLFVVVAISTQLYLNDVFLKSAFIAILIVCVVQLIRLSKKSKILFIMLSYMMLYYVKLKSYLFNEVIIFNPNPFDNHKYTYKTLFLYEIFFLILFSFIRVRNFSFLAPRIKHHYNKYIFYTLLLLAVSITVFAKNGQYLFVGGSDASYGENNVKTSGLIEYVLFILFTASIFKPKGIFYNLVFFGVALFYAFKNLLLGGRIETLQLGLLFFVLFFEMRLKWKMLIPFFLFVYYVMVIYENIRLNPLQAVSSSIGDILLIPFSAIESESFISNEGEVFSSANRLVSMADEVIPAQTRGLSFLAFIGSVIIPYDYLPDYAVLDTYLQKRYISYGGGVIIGYIYFWAGLLSIIIVPYLIGVFIRVISTARNQYLLFYGILFIATMPRWFAYNPIVLIKLNVFGLLLYTVCVAFHIDFFTPKKD